MINATITKDSSILPRCTLLEPVQQHSTLEATLQSKLSRKGERFRIIQGGKTFGYLLNDEMTRVELDIVKIKALAEKSDFEKFIH